MQSPCESSFNSQRCRAFRVFDINSLASRKCAFEYGGTAFTSMQELLNQSTAVIVSSPNFAIKNMRLKRWLQGSMYCVKTDGCLNGRSGGDESRASQSAYIPIMGFNYRHLTFVKRLKI
ncbi:hypothetical protein PO124_05540 [Bacillus licheniformis]|nr:hypothetical protein [Bacillus licheniformis]